METNLLKLKNGLILLLITISIPLTAQVGIGTTSPEPGSALDISSTDKGLLIPRVSIADLSTIAPITGGATESLLVYNTSNSTGKGYHYWNGTVWVRVISDDWKLTGNTGTDEDVNFVGTTDGEALTFRTDNIERFRVADGDQVHAMGNGSAAAPFYSWDADKTMGFWRSGTRQMDMVINGSTFYNANANTGSGSDLEWSFNPGGFDMNIRFETDNNANSLFVSGENDNVGLGTNDPNVSAQLDMADINKGLLINRVSLTATNDASPVTSPATGLLVYNTATGSTGALAVYPGFYYWNGAAWIAMGGTNGKDWGLEGNAGTNPLLKFIGTTDATDVVVKTDNTERMRILAVGNTSMGGEAPYTDTAVRINKASEDYAVIGETNSAGISMLGLQSGSGIAASGQTTGNGIGVLGYAAGSGQGVQGYNTGTGLGVFGSALNNHGIYGNSAFTGGAYLTGGAVGWGSGNNGANGVLAIADKQASSASNIGIRAVSGSTTSISSSSVLNVGLNTNATDLAIYAITEGPISSGGTRTDHDAATFQTNYQNAANDADARDPRARLAGYVNNGVTPLGTSNTYYGAYLYSGGSNSNSSYAYAGTRHNGVNYKIIGNGVVSTIIGGTSEADEKRIMFAPEAPEVLFEDYGTAELVNGTATIAIDPIFGNNIVVDASHPLKVFIQLEGDCNGVYVTSKSAEGFVVKELQNGNNTVPFSWHIVANRKNDAGNGRSNESSNFADMRFPSAPKAFAPEAASSKDVRAISAEVTPDKYLSSQTATNSKAQN